MFNLFYVGFNVYDSSLIYSMVDLMYTVVV